ncbi:MAG: hypothetical protein A2X18_07480 [Bacteroidetes bacterium GWF2_40_14]|nr:MAG: hypothetical protein A2X18_07480 [Bacteroidetes bacterium GWF2_40_14]
MSTAEVISEILQISSEKEQLKMENDHLKANSVNAQKFYNSALTTEAVASLHSVSTALVRRYVKLGYIEQHPNSTDAKILVRASTALLLDFKNLRYNSKHNIN